MHGRNRREYGWRKGGSCDGKEAGIEHWLMVCKTIDKERKEIIKECGEILGGWEDMEQENRDKSDSRWTGAVWKKELRKHVEEGSRDVERGVRAEEKYAVVSMVCLREGTKPSQCLQRGIETGQTIPVWVA